MKQLRQNVFKISKFRNISISKILLIILFYSISSIAQQSYTFTHCGATGTLGPTQAQVTSAYALTNLSLVATTNPTSGIQTFTVPFTSLYRILARGAKGGNHAGGTGGSGATVQGEFIIPGGSVLHILVGQVGASRNVYQSNYSGAGGGGSFVAYNTNIPLLVAGGGGGGGYSQAGRAGTVSLNGTAGTSTNSGAGGINGGGGGAAIGGAAGTMSTVGGTGSSCSYGAGGGGFYTRGGANCSGMGAIIAGQSYTSGGFGGDGNLQAPLLSFPTTGIQGGFGGGAGSGHKAGGGGGWSGGGGDASTAGGGGGGGSFNAGTNQVNSSGTNAGNGIVIITELCYISVSGPTLICPGQSATLTTNAVSNYTWSNGSTNPFIVVSPTTTTNYSVVGQSSMNCMASNNIIVAVTPQLSLTISASTPSACANSSITFTANASGGINGYSYNWSGGLPTATYITSQTAGNYTYSVTVVDGNSCTLTQTISALFQSNPILNVASVSICPGSSATLTANGALTYTWNLGGATGNSLVASPTTATIYSVTGTSSIGCTSYTTTGVSILPLPLLSFTTFSITCASLGSATVSATGGTGPYSYSWIPTFQTSSVATGLNPNTYTLTVLDNGTGCISTATTAFTSLIPLTGTLLNTGSLTCNAATNGTAIVTNLSGGSGNQNYLWNNGNTTYSTPFVNTLGAGTWSVTVSDALTGCIINSVFPISQPPALTLNIVASSPTACVGTNIVLTSTVLGGTPGYSFSWTTGPLSNTNSVGVQTGGTYTYSLTASDSYSCSINNTISVGFVNNPILSASIIQSCPLAVNVVTVSGASTYTWFNNSNGNTFIDNPSVSTAYYVVGAALGCTTAINAWIIMKPVPFPIFSSNSPICEGKSLALSVTSATIYAWDGPGTFSSNIKNPVINPATIGNSGIYNVTVTATSGCTGTATGTVVIKPLPSISISPSSVSICLNTTSVALNATGTATLFNWSPNQGLSSTTGANVIAFPTVTKTYSTVGSLNNCTNVAVAMVHVVQPPSLTLSLSSNSFCAQAFNGSANSITLSPGGAITYTLITPPHLFNQNPNGPSMPITLLPPYQHTGLSTATLFGSNGVCTVSKPVTFTIIPNPTLTVSSSTPVICAGQSYTYTSSGATSYTWGPNSPGLSTYTGAVVVANPTVNSVFSVVGSSLGCQSTTQSNTIMVYPLPTIEVSPGTPSICIGKRTELIASGASIYTWYGPDKFFSNSPTVTVSSGQVAGTAIYKVVGTSIHNCSATANATVTSLELPTPGIIIIPGNRACLNSTVILQGSGGDIYNWEGPENYMYSGKTVTFVASNMSFGGIYTLNIIASNGCSAQTATTLTIDNLPNGSLAGKTMKGCVPYCADYYFSTSSLTTIEWTYNNITPSVIAANKTFPLCFLVPGDHLVVGKFTNTESKCVSTLSFVVEAFEKPHADFKWLPEKPIEGLEDVLFTNNSLGEEQIKWSWFFVNNDGLKIDGENANYFFQNAGEYPVAMIVKNKWGCSDSVLKYINIETEFSLYVPNVFTPNGDGRNDIFFPIMRGQKTYRLEVFDRWGERVFVSTDPLYGWDGNFRESFCKQDGYIWKLWVSPLHGNMKVMTGSVMLIR